MPKRPVHLLRGAPAEGPPPEAVSLDNCEREPIHVPGAIQPHGALVAFEPGTSIIRHASANLADWLQLGSLPLKGRPLATLLDRATWERVDAAARGAAVAGVRHQIVEVRRAGAPGGPALDGLVHRHRGQCLLELERAPAQPVDGLQVHADVSAALRGATDLEDLLTRLAQQVKRVTGLDRVMVYRFDADWHGEVAAEAREPEMEPFLGLHYPASDIPAQARELYRTNLVRYIADVGYAPVAVQPGADPVSGEPLDMSHSVLRSVSPMHLQYLRNMGVASTLTISLVVEGRLWGLVAAHHRRPTALPLRLRQACSALAVSAGYLVGWQMQKHRGDAAQRAAQIQHRVAAVFNQAEVALADAVEHAGASLLQLVGASAGMLWHRGEAVSFGRWPGGARGAELLGLGQRLLATSREELLALESLELPTPLRPDELRSACGALIVRLGDFSDSGLMWLRPEFRRELIWGGDPDKPVTLAQDAQGRPLLSPRASFERWTTLVRGRCRPWSELDLEAARAMLPLRQMLAVRDSLADALESDRRFRALLDLQSDAYWQIDADGGLVTLSKPLPVDLGPVEGRTLPDLFGPVCTEFSVATLRDALRSGQPFRDLRLTSRSQETGAEFELLLSGDPLRDRQHRVIGLHGTLTDLSPSLRAGHELRLREAAELASRSKSRFLSQVSHELRTPLNAVLGYAQMLADDSAATPLQQSRAHNIRKAGQWLLAMISDLLDVARIEAGRIDMDLRPVALAPCIEQALSTLRVQADAAAVQLRLDAPAAPVWVHADATRLGQVLLNLVSNAIKYNHPGGSVTVTLAQQGADRATIAVEDTGPGLTAEQLAQIFEPFNRLGRENQQTPGTGIGLVIARQLTEAMGGRIDVRSEPGLGSCFTLSLVATRGPGDQDEGVAYPPEPDELNRRALRAVAPPPPMPWPDGRPATVLYVEDDATNAALMQAVADSIGPVDLVHVVDAEEGLAEARRRQPAVMLIDLNLPGKDGGWLVQAVRDDRALSGTHCVAVTADAMRETLLRVRQLGFHQCWTKPLDLRWTQRALRAAIDSAQRQPRRAPLRFEDAGALRVLAEASPEWLDTLDFGVVRLDGALRATAYNLRETLFTGYEPAAVIGRPFFKDIGPCMDNPLIAGRLAAATAQGEALDLTLDYVFRLRLKREPVRLRLLAEPGTAPRFLLVDRLR